MEVEIHIKIIESISVSWYFFCILIDLCISITYIFKETVSVERKQLIHYVHTLNIHILRNISVKPNNQNMTIHKVDNELLLYQ